MEINRKKGHTNSGSGIDDGSDTEKILIIGASNDRNKFGNKAVRAYMSKGYQVFPVNPHEKTIEGIKCYNSLGEIDEKIGIASLYLPATRTLAMVSHLKKIGVKKVYVNPGTYSNDLIEKLKHEGIQPLLICSILAIGLDPKDI